MGPLPSHGSYPTSHQCLLEVMTRWKHQQGLCSTLLFPDVALAIYRLLQKHPKKIMPIELGPSEAALAHQGHVPGVPVVTLPVLSNSRVKTPPSEERRNTKNRSSTGCAPAEGDVSRPGSWWDAALMPVGLERGSSGGTRTARFRQLLAARGERCRTSLGQTLPSHPSHPRISAQRAGRRACPKEKEKGCCVFWIKRKETWHL